jgi:hypothetical protein
MKETTTLKHMTTIGCLSLFLFRSRFSWKMADPIGKAVATPQGSE